MGRSAATLGARAGLRMTVYASLQRVPQGPFRCAGARPLLPSLRAQQSGVPSRPPSTLAVSSGFPRAAYKSPAPRL